MKEPTYTIIAQGSKILADSDQTPDETRLQVETLDFVKKVEKAEEEVWPHMKSVFHSDLRRKNEAQQAWYNNGSEIDEEDANVIVQW